MNGFQWVERQTSGPLKNHLSERHTMTGDISITRPEAWTLMLAVNPHDLQFILFSKAQEGSLITNSMPLNTGMEWTKAVENAVYDNSLLLDDYGKVEIVVNAPHFVIMPKELAADISIAAQNYVAMFPDDDYDVNTCTLTKCNVAIAYGLPRGLHNFLMRTFNNAPIYHHLYPLCEHFKKLNSGTSISRMFVNIHDTYMDMVVYSKAEMMLANTFPVRNTADAAFLALHTWKSFGLDAQSDEIQLIGNRAMRDELAQQLREYVRFVMPAIYPAAAQRLGDNATEAPLDLILLATCE